LRNTSIVHLGKFYPPHNGGIETHLRDLAVRQARVMAVSAIVANAARRNERAVIEGVQVIRVARLGTIASMPVCPGLTNAIRQCPADLVHIHVPNPGAAFAFLRSGHRGKLVVTHHADTLGRKALRRLSDPFVRQVMDCADAIIVTSSRYLRSSEELNPFVEKCQVIPLGIEPVSASVNSDPVELRDVSGDPLILAIGRLVPYKGFDVLIRAMKHVNATLLLIGSGPEARELEMLASREGVQEKIRMLGRVVDLQPYFQMASIFVLPSTTRAEAFGMVQIEAMAAGLPVINTDIDSGVPEVSVHGETGLTVEPSNSDALAEAIQFLLNEDELRKKLGKAAMAKVHKEYTADLMAERTSELYRKILNRTDAE
jgi:glycosyltransferase involved in cell wall biosynthesis